MGRFIAGKCAEAKQKDWRDIKLGPGRIFWD